MKSKPTTFVSNTLREFGGGLGDLGVLLPLAILLIINNGLSATAVFRVVGLHYLITGYYFKIPLPVQPLKAMAVIAIAMNASPQLIAATGLLMGVILLLLTLGKLAYRLSSIFTKPIVRGIQLSIGLFLAEKGLTLIANPNDAFQGISLNYPGTWFTVGLAILSGLIILGLNSSRRLPATLVLIPLGIFMGVVMTPSGQLPTLSGNLTLPSLVFPSSDDFITAFVLMVIPQIPLTFSNSIISTYHVAHDYFGERARRVTPRSLCASLGIGNLIGGLFGALPCCHGAGGLTAHYRFGARTGGATIFLGSVFVGAGLLFGDSTHSLFALIPAPILGALLVYVGVEHCMLIRDILHNRQAAFVALLIGAVSAGTHNIAIGFAVGMSVGLIMKFFPNILPEEENP
jgi:SulP family sulfate permease